MKPMPEATAMKGFHRLRGFGAYFAVFFFEDTRVGESGWYWMRESRIADMDVRGPFQTSSEAYRNAQVALSH